MSTLLQNHKLVVAAAVLAVFDLSGQAVAQAPSDHVADLLNQLKSAEGAAADRLVDEIRLEWDKSGSAAADLLLSRGRQALEDRDLEAAIEHLTALTDHAPNFAEGWVARASAFAHSEMFGPAIADLEQALTLNPNHFEAIRGLASILELIDRPHDAYEAYLLVKSIHPSHPAVTEALERLEPVAKGQAL